MQVLCGLTTYVCWPPPQWPLDSCFLVGGLRLQVFGWETMGMQPLLLAGGIVRGGGFTCLCHIDSNQPLWSFVANKRVGGGFVLPP
jgi:hypothetical protein